MVHEPGGDAIKIPYQSLSADALRGVIEDYVTREGTDYGHRDYRLNEKRAQVRAQLERGEIVITFDPRTASTTLVPTRSWRP
jgi:uncharacterized protein